MQLFLISNKLNSLFPHARLHKEMADQRGPDRSKGKELATTSSESSPCWSTYNAHCVRLAIERVAGPGATDITNEEIFYQTVDELQVIVTRKSK